jgi:thymidylate synthase
MKLTTIKGYSIEDVWHQTIYACVEHGRDFQIDRGSYAGQKRKEFDMLMLQFKTPWAEPLLPKIAAHHNIPDPVDEEWFYGSKSKNQRSYIEYLMSDVLLKNESYTYGQRLTCHQIDYNRAKYPHMYDKKLHVQDQDVFKNRKIIPFENGDFFLNQIEYVIDCYLKHGFRNNQMVLQIATPDDLLLKDPPCLRSIDTRIQDNALHFFVHFRSWDLWGGMPANIAAIEILNQYMAQQLNVKNGEIFAACKGAHLYDDVWEIARCLKGVAK